MIEAKVYERKSKEFKKVESAAKKEDKPKKKRFKYFSEFLLLLMFGLLASISVHTALLIIAVYTTGIFIKLTGGFRE
jgi:hypothetical protein